MNLVNILKAYSEEGVLVATFTRENEGITMHYDDRWTSNGFPL